MTDIDQFESVFKAADKPQFALEPINIQRGLAVTDLDAEESAAFLARVKQLLGARADAMEWSVVDGPAYQRVPELLAQIEDRRPELICTYRNLHTPANDYPYSLGVYVDVLAQAAAAPLLLLPHPQASPENNFAAAGTNTVMAVTDHLTGDAHLVSTAAWVTAEGGRLLLTHVEDEAALNRYLATIAKIPAIDTDTAEQALRRQLLKEPHDYILSCRDVLKQRGLPLEIEEIVTFGHRLNDYQRLISEHGVELLVMNTKDQEQSAMHGQAYPLSIELRELPLLLL